MSVDFDTRTKFKLGDEVRFRIGARGRESVGKVVAIHLSADLHVSYALEVAGHAPDMTRTGLTKIAEEKIRGLSDNMPWTTRMRQRLHIR